MSRDGSVNSQGRILDDPTSKPTSETVSANETQNCVVCGASIHRNATKYCSLACYRIVQRSGSLADRFWAKVRKTHGCWLWTASILGGTGYGAFGMQRADGRAQPQYAHRVAWALTHGPIPHGQWVLHHCDTPLCVRPDHLFLGTQKHNMEDAARKGRLSVPRPSRRKITDEQREDIRQRYAAGDVTMQTLADEHDVTKTHIWKIVHKKSVEFRARRTA